MLSINLRTCLLVPSPHNYKMRKLAGFVNFVIRYREVPFAVADLLTAALNAVSRRFAQSLQTNTAVVPNGRP